MTVAGQGAPARAGALALTLIVTLSGVAGLGQTQEPPTTLDPTTEWVASYGCEQLKGWAHEGLNKGFERWARQVASTRVRGAALDVAANGRIGSLVGNLDKVSDVLDAGLELVAGDPATAGRKLTTLALDLSAAALGGPAGAVYTVIKKLGGLAESLDAEILDINLRNWGRAAAQDPALAELDSYLEGYLHWNEAAPAGISNREITARRAMLVTYAFRSLENPNFPTFREWQDNRNLVRATAAAMLAEIRQLAELYRRQQELAALLPSLRAELEAVRNFQAFWSTIRTLTCQDSSSPCEELIPEITVEVVTAEAVPYRPLGIADLDPVRRTVDELDRALDRIESVVADEVAALGEACATRAADAGSPVAAAQSRIEAARRAAEAARGEACTTSSPERAAVAVERAQRAAGEAGDEVGWLESFASWRASEPDRGPTSLEPVAALEARTASAIASVHARLEESENRRLRLRDHLAQAQGMARLCSGAPDSAPLRGLRERLAGLAALAATDQGSIRDALGTLERRHAEANAWLGELMRRQAEGRRCLATAEAETSEWRTVVERSRAVAEDVAVRAQEAASCESALAPAEGSPSTTGVAGAPTSTAPSFVSRLTAALGACDLDGASSLVDAGPPQSLSPSDEDAYWRLRDRVVAELRGRDVLDQLESQAAQALSGCDLDLAEQAVTGLRAVRVECATLRQRREALLAAVRDFTDFRADGLAAEARDRFNGAVAAIDRCELDAGSRELERARELLYEVTNHSCGTVFVDDYDQLLQHGAYVDQLLDDRRASIGELRRHAREGSRLSEAARQSCSPATFAQAKAELQQVLRLAESLPIAASGGCHDVAASVGEARARLQADRSLSQQCQPAPAAPPQPPPTPGGWTAIGGSTTVSGSGSGNVVVEDADPCAKDLTWNARSDRFECTCPGRVFDDELGRCVPGGTARAASPAAGAVDGLIRGASEAFDQCRFGDSWSLAQRLAAVEPDHPWLTANQDRIRSLAERQRAALQSLADAEAALRRGDEGGSLALVRRAASEAPTCMSSRIADVAGRIAEQTDRDRRGRDADRRAAAGELLSGLLDLWRTATESGEDRSGPGSASSGGAPPTTSGGAAGCEIVSQAAILGGTPFGDDCHYLVHEPSPDPTLYPELWVIISVPGRVENGCQSCRECLEAHYQKVAQGRARPIGTYPSPWGALTAAKNVFQDPTPGQP